MSLLALGIVALFSLLTLLLAARARRQGERPLRHIPAFHRLKQEMALSVEAGQQVHLALGHGGLFEMPGAATFLALTMLQHTSRLAAVSDYPPVATSGEAVQGLLSQEIAHAAARLLRAEEQFTLNLGQINGLTPFSYAAGALTLVSEPKVAVNAFGGSFGSEAALLSDAALKRGNLVLAGSENLTAQAVFFPATETPLLGEEFFAAAAYLQGGTIARAALLAQDIFRWALIVVLLGGALLKLVGVW